jgi:hypothetical protein
MNQKHTWPIQLYANGELEISARLSDEQIKHLRTLIIDMEVRNQMEGVK